jgi:hypothetical protein
MGDHAGTGAISIQRPHRVAGTAELECATALQVLGLERQLRAGQRIERARAQHRGHAGVRAILAAASRTSSARGNSESLMTQD